MSSEFLRNIRTKGEKIKLCLLYCLLYPHHDVLASVCAYKQKGNFALRLWNR